MAKKKRRKKSPQRKSRDERTIQIALITAILTLVKSIIELLGKALEMLTAD